MVSWWFSPIDKVSANRFSPAAFGMHGFVPAGYALFAFALGAATGLLFRRTLPAMAVTLAGFIVARVAVAEWIRPHFMSPVTGAFRLSPNDGWGISQSSGRALSQRQSPESAQCSGRLERHRQPCRAVPDDLVPAARMLQPARPQRAPFRRPASAARLRRPTGQQAFQQCVDTVSTHFHQIVVYQPANRFWAFQTYETLLFVVLSAALAGFCVWWVRRRLN